MAKALQQKVLDGDWLYLALGAEILPLLKRGFLPLSLLSVTKPPWLCKPAVAVPGSVPEKDYIAHMQREYDRLPASLAGLISFDHFLQQAQGKRGAIEKALLANMTIATQREQVADGEWLLQDFYTQPYSSLAWLHSAQGLGAVWLALDAGHLSGDVKPVDYRSGKAPRYQEQLWSAPADLAPLAQQRLLMEKAQIDKFIQLAGKEYGLMRLPPKAIKAALLGGEVTFRDEFIAFWQQDFRYQRTPLLGMNWDAGEMDFGFETIS